MFKITDGKGFHITLDNGFTLSVQFGYANYGDNYDVPAEELRRRAAQRQNIESVQAEIYCWKEGSKDPVLSGFTFDENGKIYSDVKGYVDAAEVLRHLNLLAALPADFAGQPVEVELSKLEGF